MRSNGGIGVAIAASQVELSDNGWLTAMWVPRT
jgi:hypothetical protein